MKTIRIGKKTIEIYSIEGKVIAPPEKRYEHDTYSSGLSSSNSSQTIKTDIIVAIDLFLEVADGQQKAFKLRSLDLLCLEGHRVKLFTIGEKGKTQYYLAASNLTTGTNYFCRKQLEDMFRPDKLKAMVKAALIGLIPLPVCWITIPMGLFFAARYVEKTGKKSVDDFINTFSPQDYVESDKF